MEITKFRHCYVIIMRIPGFVFTCLFCFLFHSEIISQDISIPVNEYGLEVVGSVELYDQIIKGDSSRRMVDLKEYIPGIILDIKYATPDNFTGEKIYDKPDAFLRLEAAAALKKVEDELNMLGYGLKIYDAYRPYAATIKFYEVYRDTNFIATPWGGSRHNRGCAVDVSLVDLDSGEELLMPTAFDDFSEKAAPDYMDLPETAIKNRELLIRIMAKYGFVVYRTEWWHFDFSGWEKYEILNIDHDDL